MARKRAQISLPPETLEELDRRVSELGGTRSSQIAAAIEATAKASPAQMAEEIASEPARRLLQNGNLPEFTRSAQRIIEGKP